MRTSTTLALSGELLINGRPHQTIQNMKHRFSYVTQEDALYEQFTPFESILTTAKLSGIANPEGRTNELIEWLGLEKCKNTQVGGGLSGGERKRTAIALELINDPSFIFLDEPTTGLDSKSALNVASILKMLATNGRTVVAIVHQPSTEIISRFDNIICLCEGKMVFDGPVNRIHRFFFETGFEPLPHTNPTDHLMTILHDDDIKIKALRDGITLTKEKVRSFFKEKLEKLVAHYQKNSKPMSSERCSDSDYSTLIEAPKRPGWCF